MTNFSVWIIEASGKTKAFKSALGKIGRSRDRVLSTYGRILDLDDSITSISKGMLKDESLIRWKELRPGQSDKIAQMCHGASEIFIATDSDLEGELIAHHLYKSLSSPDLKVSRVNISAISPDHIKASINAKSGIDLKKISAAVSRRLFDRHIGFQLNSKEDHFPLSMGRIISPLIKSLSDRPPITTRIECELNRGWKAVFNLPVHLSPQAETLCGVLSSLPVITPIEISKEKVFRDSKPLIGSDALVICSNKTSLSVDGIIDALQENYMDGDISYPRTDSRKMGEISMKWAKLIANKNGLPFSLATAEEKTKAIVDDSQDAHEAIIPMTDRMCGVNYDAKRLSDRDKVLSVITKHCSMIGSDPEEMVIEKGGFASDSDSKRWESTTKGYSRYMSLERVTNSDGVCIKDAYSEVTRKPDHTEPRVRLWRDSPQLSAAKRLIELGLGRPSTLGVNSKKASKIYLDEYAQVNGRANLMIHRVKERCPMLIEPGVAKKIERYLVDISDDSSVEDRVKSAWLLIDNSPEKDTNSEGFSEEGPGI